MGRSVQTPADVIRWPYALSFFNHGYGGLVGPLFLIFLPFLLLGPLPEKKWLLWALLLLACAPFLTASLRFVYIAFVVLAIFSLRAFEAAAGKLLKAVFYALIAVNFVMGIALLEKFYHFQNAWGGQFSRNNTASGFSLLTRPSLISTPRPRRRRKYFSPAKPGIFTCKGPTGFPRHWITAF